MLFWWKIEECAIPKHARLIYWLFGVENAWKSVASEEASWPLSLNAASHKYSSGRGTCVVPGYENSFYQQELAIRGSSGLE